MTVKPDEVFFSRKNLVRRGTRNSFGSRMAWPPAVHNIFAAVINGLYHAVYSNSSFILSGTISRTIVPPSARGRWKIRRECPPSAFSCCADHFGFAARFGSHSTAIVFNLQNEIFRLQAQSNPGLGRLRVLDDIMNGLFKREEDVVADFRRNRNRGQLRRQIRAVRRPASARYSCAYLPA